MNRIITKLFLRFLKSEQTSGLILLLCTVISIWIANGAGGEAYIDFFHKKLDLSFSEVSLNLTIEHWVNDGLMAIFFLMVGLEVERELYVGELSDFKKAILPISAAFGGMIVPAAIHLALNYGTSTQAGFAIPMATDIAFALGILSLAGKRVPISVKIFLTALAIIDDIGAILIIATMYTQTIYFGYLMAAILIFGVLLAMNRAGVENVMYYLLPGVVMWYCFLHSGVHATISGVLLAFAIPFRKNVEWNISDRLLQTLHIPVAFLIVPIFALTNTAIIIPGNIGEALTSSNSLGIIFGLIAGKLIGIFGVPLLMVKSGLAKMQEGVTWRNLVGIGLMGGIGFTMSIFITNLAFGDAELIVASKLSILLASTIAAIAGLTLFLTGEKPHRFSGTNK